AGHIDVVTVGTDQYVARRSQPLHAIDAIEVGGDKLQVLAGAVDALAQQVVPREYRQRVVAAQADRVQVFAVRTGGDIGRRVDALPRAWQVALAIHLDLRETRIGRTPAQDFKRRRGGGAHGDQHV